MHLVWACDIVCIVHALWSRNDHTANHRALLIVILIIVSWFIMRQGITVISPNYVVANQGLCPVVLSLQAILSGELFDPEALAEDDTDRIWCERKVYDGLWALFCQNLALKSRIAWRTEVGVRWLHEQINDMLWYDMIWCDMIWYDIIWYDMIIILLSILLSILQYPVYYSVYDQTH